MPEREFKPPVLLTKRLWPVFMALAALSFPTACLPASSARSTAPIPAPSAPISAQPAAAPPADAPAAAPDHAPVLEAAAPTFPAAGIPSYEPGFLRSAPGLWPREFIFTSGLIDQRALAAPLAGPLVTAQAGGRLLLANGLPFFPDGLAETRLSPAPITFSSPPAPLAAADQAPSAGAAEPGLSSVGAGRPLARKQKNSPAQTADLLTAAYQQTGRRYKAGGASPASGFDAAGFTHWVFAAQGLNLPATSAGLATAGLAVAREALRPGDVLIYRNSADPSGGWHVGIYSGQGNFLHASPKAGVVTETDAFGPQYAPYFVGGRRFYDDPEAAPLSEVQKTAAASQAVKMALAELAPAKPLPTKTVHPAQAGKKS